MQGVAAAATVEADQVMERAARWREFERRIVELHLRQACANWRRNIAQDFARGKVAWKAAETMAEQTMRLIVRQEEEVWEAVVRDQRGK